MIRIGEARAVEAEQFAQSFYNIDRQRFIWKAGMRFGYGGHQYRIAVAHWETIQADMEIAYDY